MNYVVLRAYDHEGYSYEKAFLTLEEAEKYIGGQIADHNIWFEIWDLNTNTEVIET